MGNDANHYAFPHIIGYQTGYPFNTISHFKVCHRILRFPEASIPIRLILGAMLSARFWLANPFLTYGVVRYVPTASGVGFFCQFSSVSDADFSIFQYVAAWQAT